MSDDRSFSRREIVGALTFVGLAAAIGISSYFSGVRLAGAGGGASMEAAATTTTVNGQAIYAGNCAGCHGGQAQGGMGPGLTGTKTWTEAAFSEAVLHGKHPGGRELAPVMPRFADTGLDGAPATEEQIKAIHAYVKGL